MGEKKIVCQNTYTPPVYGIYRWKKVIGNEARICRPTSSFPLLSVGILRLTFQRRTETLKNNVREQFNENHLKVLLILVYL